MPPSPLNLILYLGDVDFQAFEIPESISAGGTQTLVEHKYPGGIRTLDSMGPDDADITWTGIFTGPYAELRCKQIDRMRRQGLPQPLSFAMESWIVKIRSFTWQFKRPDQIDYSIALCVITDETQQPPEGSESPDDLYYEDWAAVQAAAQEMANAALDYGLTFVGPAGPAALVGLILNGGLASLPSLLVNAGLTGLANAGLTGLQSLTGGLVGIPALLVNSALGNATGILAAAGSAAIQGVTASVGMAVQNAVDNVLDVPRMLAGAAMAPIMDAINTQVAGISSIANAPVALLNGLQSSLAQASGIAQIATTGMDAAIVNSMQFGLAVNFDPAIMADNVNKFAKSAVDLPVAMDLSARIDRMQSSIDDLLPEQRAALLQAAHAP